MTILCSVRANLITHGIVVSFCPFQKREVSLFRCVKGKILRGRVNKGSFYREQSRLVEDTLKRRTVLDQFFSHIKRKHYCTRVSYNWKLWNHFSRTEKNVKMCCYKIELHYSKSKKIINGRKYIYRKTISRTFRGCEAPDPRLRRGSSERVKRGTTRIL